MAEDGSHGTSAYDSSTTIVNLLCKFLAVQQRRAEAYSNLKRFLFPSALTIFFSFCISFSVPFFEEEISLIQGIFRVIEMESLFQNSEYDRVDLAKLLRSVQEQEKQKLNLNSNTSLPFSYSAILNVLKFRLESHIVLHYGFAFVLKKAGRPSERLVSHADCKFEKPMEHECVHVHEITEAVGTEEAEADAMYDKELKEAIRGLQDVVIAINEHLEEVRYEVVALESE
ncbi:uncharacterized protein LOC133832879 [Humulus lupulus]|uniref:uncharacterized protein LOC133832879 n=1 Tax=Humulus lupulus TaxID=3486 RepID=UPI002B4184EB|nr:uncharacterized protein LOC133832879 [Humulus lupulus]